MNIIKWVLIGSLTLIGIGGIAGAIATFGWGALKFIALPFLLLLGTLFIFWKYNLKDRLQQKFDKILNRKKVHSMLSGSRLVLVTIGVLSLIYLLVLLFTTPLMLPGGYEFSWSQLYIWVACLYFIFSFRFWGITETGGISFAGLFNPGLESEEKIATGYIGANEFGIRFLLGRPIDILDSGVPFAPLLAFQLEKLPVVPQQKEYPAEPENIYRGAMKGEEMPPNSKPPVRITFRSAVTQREAAKLLGSEYSVIDPAGNELEFHAPAPKDGLARRVTAEVVPVVRWRIKPERGIDFVRNIGSISEANRQIEDEIFSVLQRLLPNMSVGQAKQNFRWINAILINAVIQRTSEWGIEVIGAFLKMIPLNHDLNNAIALAAEADFQGRGERELIEQRGAGTASAARDLERDTLYGRADGLRQLAASLGIEGEDAIRQFVAGQLASGQGTIVLGADGFAQLAGLATTALADRSRPTSPTSTGDTNA